MSDVATRQRAADRGLERGRRLVAEIGRELRSARRDRGLSLARVAAAVGCSASEISRIERGLVPGVSIVLLAQLASVVGLDLAARCYAGGAPIRDAGHLRLLREFAAALHPLLRWRTEVPVAGAGDQRAWDGEVSGVGWRVGVEAETAPRDWQALSRRLELKRRDGEVDAVILLVPDTRHVRAFLAASDAMASELFPVASRQVMARLRAGKPPGGGGVVVLRQAPLAAIAPDARNGTVGDEPAHSAPSDATSIAVALDRASGGTFGRLR